MLDVAPILHFASNRQTGDMTADEREDRRAAQAVETVLALILGLATSVAVLLVSWVVRSAIGIDGSAWLKFSVISAAVLGGAVLVWRLLRARRFGL